MKNYTGPPDYVSTTKRGGLRWIVEGYAHVVDKRGRDEVIFWRCDRKDELQCKGKLISEDDSIVKVTGLHCHAPDATKNRRKSRIQLSTVAEARGRQPCKSFKRLPEVNCHHPTLWKLI
eukprot:scpid112323/ scgid35350/ 